MTQQWWTSSGMTMTWLIGRRWSSWWPGVAKTTRDRCRIQEEAAPPHSTSHQQHSCGAGQQHQVPHLVCEHCGSGQKGTAASALPVKDEESPPALPILTTSYRSTTESILTSCISMWCGSCKSSDWRNVRTVERISGTSLPSIQDIAPKCCMSRAGNIIRGSSHPHCFLCWPLEGSSVAFGAGPQCSGTAPPHVFRLLNSQGLFWIPFLKIFALPNSKAALPNGLCGHRPRGPRAPGAQ